MCGIHTNTSRSQQSRVPIVINSLVLNDPACFACSGPLQTLYYYNASGTWLPFTVDPPTLDFCNAVLEVVAPTQLIVSGALTMNQPASVAPSQLRLITQPTNTTLTPYVIFEMTLFPYKKQERGRPFLLTFSVLPLKIDFRGEL